MWKEVIGFEGYYEVSDTGEVRSIDRTYEISDSMDRKYKVKKRGKVIARREHQFGYYVVTLSKGNIQYTRTVHKLVADAFLGEREKGQLVRHLDGNPKNNTPANLAFGSQKDNFQDAIRHGTVERGEDRYNAKLSKSVIMEIRVKKAAGARNIDLAKEYGLTDIYIHSIVTGKKWASVGGPITDRRISNILRGKDRDAVISMRHEGCSLKEIAERFNVSITQVRNILERS